MWFIWVDVDKNKLKSKLLIDQSFFKNNIILVFSISIFFMIHEFVEETNFSNSYLYFEFFELLGFICIAVFMFSWYSTLKHCAERKSVHESLLEVFSDRKGNGEYPHPFSRMSLREKYMIMLVVCSAGLIAARSVPVSTLYFAFLIGLLFVPPILFLASMLIGASIISKNMNIRP